MYSALACGVAVRMYSKHGETHGSKPHTARHSLMAIASIAPPPARAVAPPARAPVASPSMRQPPARRRGAAAACTRLVSRVRIAMVSKAIIGMVLGARGMYSPKVLSMAPSSGLDISICRNASHSGRMPDIAPDGPHSRRPPRCSSAPGEGWGWAWGWAWAWGWGWGWGLLQQRTNAMLNMPLVLREVRQRAVYPPHGLERRELRAERLHLTRLALHRIVNVLCVLHHAMHHAGHRVIHPSVHHAARYAMYLAMRHVMHGGCPSDASTHYGYTCYGYTCYGYTCYGYTCYGYAHTTAMLTTAMLTTAMLTTAMLTTAMLTTVPAPRRRRPMMRCKGGSGGRRCRARTCSRLRHSART